MTLTISEFINKIGFKVKNEDVEKVNGTIADIKNTATKVLGAIGIGFSLSAINGLVEEFGAVNKSIASSVGEMGNVEEAQKKILDGANAVKTSYGDMANTVSNLMKSDEKLFPLDDAITFTSNVTKLMKVSGRSGDAINSMMEGFNKSFQKGIVDTETLNKMLEQCPETANLLAEKTGYAKTKLLDMASKGTLKVQDLKDAFISATDEIDKQFAKSGMSITSALQNIRNKWGFWLAQQNKTFGVTNALGKALVSAFDKGMAVLNKFSDAMKWLAEKVGGTDNLLKLLAITAGAIFVAFNFSKIVDGIKKVMSALGGLNLKALAIAAVIILIALLVDDFINFMQGNDSLMGSLLEKAGVDCDALRETIIGAWDAIKEKLAIVWEHLKEAGSKVWEGIKAAAEAIFEALKAFWAKWGDEIIDTFTKVFGYMGDIFNGFIDIIVGLADFIAAVFSGDWAAAWEAIKDVFIGIWDVLVASLSMVWEEIKLIFQICLDFVLGLWTTIWNGICEFFKGIWNSIVSFLQGVWNTISSAISTFCSNIWNGITSTFTNIWNSITSTVGNIKSAIIDGFTAAIDWIKALPSQAFQWGKDIIMGIVNGIKSCISAVGDAVSGVANKIKSFLHFSEPDEGPLSDFHTYMPDMIDLMSKGIIAGKSKVKDALGGLTGEMAVMAKADIVASSTAAAARGGNNVSKSVVQKVEINNEFNGDAAIQRSASSAMDNSAKDITAQLARGLALAR